jgi:hypothetical protein
MSTIYPADSPGNDSAPGSNETANRLLQMLIQAAERNEMRGAMRTDTSTIFEEALLKRLESLTEQLAPLRELKPQLEAPPANVVAELRAIRQALERPNWANAGRLFGTPDATPRDVFTGAAGPYQSY